MALLPTFFSVEPLKDVPIEKAIKPKAIVDIQDILSTYCDINPSLIPSYEKLLNKTPKTNGPIIIPVMI